MRDAMEARMWAEHRHAFSAQVGGLIDQLAHAFRRLNARLYDAPWRPRAAERCVDRG